MNIKCNMNLLDKNPWRDFAPSFQTSSTHHWCVMQRCWTGNQSNCVIWQYKDLRFSCLLLCGIGLGLLLCKISYSRCAWKLSNLELLCYSVVGTKNYNLLFRYNLLHWSWLHFTQNPVKAFFGLVSRHLNDIKAKQVYDYASYA